LTSNSSRENHAEEFWDGVGLRRWIGVMILSEWRERELCI
jgi:hypothetical protein